MGLLSFLSELFGGGGSQKVTWGQAQRDIQAQQTRWNENPIGYLTEEIRSQADNTSNGRLLTKRAQLYQNNGEHQKTVDLLHSIKGGQLDKGLPTTGGAYVFTRPNGLPLIPQEATKAFTGFVREHNLPHLTLHGLRHANATLQMAAGINPKVVSEGLGHSNISITLDLYSHVLPNMQQHAVDAVADLLERE